jgi:hypothetical protein
MTGTSRHPPWSPNAKELPAVPRMIGGPMNFVTEAPTLPAPKTPSAKPCRSRPYHAAFHAMPTEKRLPAKPTRNARTRSMP